MADITRQDRKFWFKNLKAYERSVEKIFQYQEYDDQGRIVISVKPETLFEKLNGNPRAELDRDLFSYISERAFLIPLRYSLVVRFIGTYSQEEQATIRTLFKHHYDEQLMEKADELNINAGKAGMLAIIGAVLLLISYGVLHLTTNSLVTQVLSIASSFAMWECVDTFFLARRSIRDDMMNIIQLAFSDVQFPGEKSV
ncbi:MAG: hypothetical protein LKE39_12200 [Sphaerochaeta sp.]|jgi:hypothetical protein|nr:hypothetical protein [Sphaerochaeta sp.]MCH3921190.1 hypothetical protein [Sphaerochaeta sp.]MCI2045453.1 hypothetical protein [Sphaerochaeta sp.]MCI2076374.1 hypothetical protein [Sphaerochaeta sp.]MCI2097326.1 hypothetical protein [Sphaerochaeta sp.]